jgi:outer membrane protein OmpA-like peptidoglycan-associated protein
MSFSGIDGFGLKRHLNGLVAYNQKIGENWMLTPSIYTKGTNNGYQLDLNADATYKKRIFGGLGYRTSVGLIARAGIQVQDLFFIGYAYETPMSNIASYSSGSHEIILGIKFCKKKPKTTPEIAETKKETPDSLNNTLRNEEISSLPTLDTIVITRVDTVYIEAAVEEIVEVKQVQAEKKDFIPIEKDVLFEFDKAIVQKGSFGALESIVNILNNKSELKISLQGHTDAQGPENYNVMLSKNRVSAVRDFLLSNGINANRIVIEALGEKVPIADNSSKAMDRIQETIFKTPLLPSMRYGSKLMFKAENFQETGSFKIRGALSKLTALAKEKKLR